VVGPCRRAKQRQDGHEAGASQLTFASGSDWNDALLVAAWPLPLQRASWVLTGLAFGSALVLLGSAPLLDALRACVVGHGWLRG